MRHKHRWILLLAVVGMVLAACGGGTADTTAAPGTQAPGTTAAPSATTAPPGTQAMELKTDYGVDVEAGTISVGMLSDLTGPFGPLVTAILAGTQAYWDEVNANGGINGLKVELVTRDTQYVVDNHIQFYNEIKDQVVAIGHSTGSPHTVAIVPQLQEDGMLAIPLTWYSGWSDPKYNSNLLSHGTPYCIEAMNTIGYLKDQKAPDATKIAIASLPGDYGQDSAEGAKKAAEAAGLEIAYDGEGQIIPSDETTLTAVADGIAGSGAEIVWVATTPSTFSAIYGQAIAKGFKAIWSGPSPSWSPAYIAPDSPIKDAITADMVWGTYTANWTNSASADWVAKFTAAGMPVTDYYMEGVVEATILHQALLKAYESGDMTRAGVLAAGKSLDNVDFGGIAPSESYVGDPNTRVQRKGYINVPDPDGLAAGTSGGTTQIESQYTSSIASAYQFDEACYQLAG